MIDHNGHIKYHDPISGNVGTGMAKMKWRRVVEVATRNGISDNVTFQLAYAAIQDVHDHLSKVDNFLAEIVNPQKFALSRDTIRRQRLGLLKLAPNMIRELTKALPATIWAYRIIFKYDIDAIVDFC